MFAIMCKEPNRSYWMQKAPWRGRPPEVLTFADKTEAVKYAADLERSAARWDPPGTKYTVEPFERQ